MAHLPTRISGIEEKPNVRRAQRGPIMLAILLAANAAWADEELDNQVEQVWSATIIGDFKIITDRHADDGIGAFFDQYEFTPNKSSSVPFELGIRSLSYDRFGPGQTPQVQLRFESPTSNLGVSGSQVDEPFLNQRAELFQRSDGIALDLRYWRLRTEDLRLFPNTQGRQFDDLTRPGDRFNRDRTGMFAEARLRPRLSAIGATKYGEWFSPELSLRGGFEERDGTQQLRFMQNQSNRWGAITQSMNQSTAKAGGGLLVAPGGLFTMTLDFDYDRFRHNSSTITERKLGPGFLQENDSVGFIPDSDRVTGTVLLQSRIGEWAVLEGGFHVSRLEQVGDFTPTQVAAGLDDNQLLFYSVNAAADLNITDRISANTFFKYDQRKNQIQRDTSLFNPVDNDKQSGPFLKRWDRIYAGAEFLYQLHRRNMVAVGTRFEWIDRDLEFALPANNRVILEPNARVANRTKLWTVYGRTNLRPMKGLGLSGELGYRGAPSTGYILDLDKYVYGKFRASYVIPIVRPVVLMAFVRGGSGENRKFSMTNGTGAVPAGSEVPLKFERRDIVWGLTVTSSPWDNVSLFASFFRARNEQNYDLVLSRIQRYWQSSQVVDFFEDGALDSHNKQMSFSLGTRVRFSDKTDGGLSYSFTRAALEYDHNAASVNVERISNNRGIDSDIHGIQVDVGHWLRDGLRVEAGYRLQRFRNSTALPSGTGSVVRPIAPSMTQHTVTLGVTLTSELLTKSHSE